jgi:hypothetical protein
VIPVVLIAIPSLLLLFRAKSAADRRQTRVLFWNFGRTTAWARQEPPRILFGFEMKTSGLRGTATAALNFL